MSVAKISDRRRDAGIKRLKTIFPNFQVFRVVRISEPTKIATIADLPSLAEIAI